jgi:hypothetical protein
MGFLGHLVDHARAKSASSDPLHTPADPAPALAPEPVVATPGPAGEHEFDDPGRILQRDEQTPLEVGGASPEAVVAAFGHLVDAVFIQQTQAVEQAFIDLAKQDVPATSGALAVLGSIAEAVIGLALGQIGSLVVSSLRLAEADSKAVSSKLEKLAGSVAKATGGIIAKAPAGRSAPLEQRGRRLTGAGLLKDEYQRSVELQLALQQTFGRAQLALDSTVLASLPGPTLASMATRLYAIADANGVKPIYTVQHTEVLLGWSRACAAATLGEAEGHPDVARAQEAAPGLEGFVDVYVTCPDAIDGVKGCKVARAVVNSHSAVRNVLKDDERMVGHLPVYRKVFLGSAKTGGGWATPAFVLSPTGEVDVVDGAVQLARIGGSDASPWSKDNAPDEYRRAVSAAYAETGATFVKDLLDRTTSKDVVE